MKVVLVNSPPYKVQEPFYDTPPYPRTTLAFLAAALRENSIDVSVVDCKYDRISHEKAVDMICAELPDIVGYTALTNEVIQAARLAEDVKKIMPDTTAILGGVHASVLPEETLREFNVFDYVCVGEGETTIVEFVKHIENAGGEPPNINGIAFIDSDGNYVFGGEREKIGIKSKSLDSIPIPAWDLFKPATVYLLHTQRGCPYSCPFCINPNGRIVRKESPARVVDQIQELYNKYGCNEFYFGDEIFTIDRKRVISFCEELISRGLNKKLKWRCDTCVNCIDYELAVMMKKAGCYLVALGIESGNDDRLKAIGKGTTAEKILGAAAQLRRAKMPFQSYFILGQPDETEKTAMETIDFAVKLNANIPIFGIMVPYPGTEIGRMTAAGEGGYILASDNWNDYNKQLGDALQFTGISRKRLVQLQMKGYISVFLKNRRYIDFTKFCWKYKKEGISAVRQLFRKAE